MAKQRRVQTSAGPLSRCHDWDLRLLAYLKSHLKMRGVWGKHDCCAFACGAVAEETGVDLMSGIRGAYHNKTEAKRVIAQLSGVADGNLEAAAVAIAARHQMPEVAVLCAQRGDVVLLDTPGGPGLGIVDFNGTEAVGAGLSGLVRVPIGACRRAWRV